MLTAAAVTAKPEGDSDSGGEHEPTFAEGRGGDAPERPTTQRELIANERLRNLSSHDTLGRLGIFGVTLDALPESTQRRRERSGAEETKRGSGPDVIAEHAEYEPELLPGEVPTLKTAPSESDMSAKAVAFRVAARRQAKLANKALTRFQTSVKRTKSESEQQRILRKLNAQRWVIREESPFLRAWDLWFIFALVWVVVRVPFSVAFAGPADEQAAISFWRVMDALAEGSFILDMGLRFFAEYQDDGDEVLALPLISWHYFSGWFAVDVIASFPYWLVASGLTLDLLMFLRLLRMMKVEYFEQRISTWLELSPTSQGLLRLVKLMTYMLMSAHVTGCMWFLIATQENDVDNTWTHLYGVADGTWKEKYISSVYWSFVTLTTVGYGDISAHTDLERLFSLVMLILGAAMFATLVGKISALSQMLNAKQSEGTRRRDEVAYYLKTRDIPVHLRKRTRTYYEYISHLETFLNEEHMLDDLSPPLRRAVSVHLNAELLSDVPVLRSSDPAFQAAIVSMLRPTVVLSGEYVICAGDVGYELYVLRTGQVVVLGLDGTEMYLLQSGSFFGEDQLLYRQRASVSARARSHCEMYRLQRANFQALVHDFPKFEATLRGVATDRKQYHRRMARDKKEHSSGDHGHHRDSVRAETPPPGYNDWAEVKAIVTQMSLFPSGNQLARNRIMAAIEYMPKPLDLLAESIPTSLEPLVEAMSMNMHEVWAVAKINKAWTYAPSRDDLNKTHPDLQPYECLSDGSKAFDRRLSKNIVRFVLSRGYAFTPGASMHLQAWLDLLHDSADGFRAGCEADPSKPPTYQPHPFPVDIVTLTPAVRELIDAISANIHEVWAEDRIKHGWQWGPDQNNELKQDPKLLPYTFLSTEEKNMNREPVLNTVKMVLAVGFELSLSMTTPATRQLRIFTDAAGREGGIPRPTPSPLVSASGTVRLAPIARRSTASSGAGAGAGQGASATA